MSLTIEGENGLVLPNLNTGWRITPPITPPIITQSKGTGTLSFSSTGNADTRYLMGTEVIAKNTDAFGIDIGEANYTIDSVTFSGTIDREKVKHRISPYGTLYPSETLFPGMLAELPGVAAINKSHGLSSLTATSFMNKLNTEVKTSINPYGVYEREIFLPKGETYTIGATTYYTGGYFDGGGNFITNTPEIYDISKAAERVYVLASGTHDGEVVYVFDRSGDFELVFPVYSDATDLASPGSRYIAVGEHPTAGVDYVAVGQTSALRIKWFSSVDGEFISQFGSSGSGDGQFQNISGLAVNTRATSPSVAVTDSTLERVTVFDWTTGSFSFKFGTPGTSTNSQFNDLNNAIFDEDGRLYVTDGRGYIRWYTETGVYLSRISDNLSLAPGLPIELDFDAQDNLYAYQGECVYKIVPDAESILSEWDFSNRTDVPPGTWTVPGADPSVRVMGSDADGFSYFISPRNTIVSYSRSVRNLYSYIRYYVSLGYPDNGLRFHDLNQPNLYTDEVDDSLYHSYFFPPWEGNLWDNLCDLLALTGNRAYPDGGRIVIDRRGVGYLPPTIPIIDLKIQAANGGRGNNVEVKYDDITPRIPGAVDTIYSAKLDDNKVITFNQDDYIELKIKTQGIYPYWIYSTPSSLAGTTSLPSVIDNEGLAVSDIFTTYDASIKVYPSDRPDEILLVIKGPPTAIPNRTPPYKLARRPGVPDLCVWGHGFKYTEVISRIGLGGNIDDIQTAKSIDSPFIINPKSAAEAMASIGYLNSDPVSTASFKLSQSDLPTDSIYQLIGTSIRLEDCDYIVTAVSIDSDGTVNVDCEQYSILSTDSSSQEGPPRFHEIWDGKTSEEFVAFWSTHRSSEFRMAPYRNPFGI